MPPKLSRKQSAFWLEQNHRWNVKSGATRSGKTYLDYFVIPRSIRERKGLDGLIVLMGNTKGTLQRNIIEPMQSIYGAGLVSSIRSDNTAMLFGERVHCLGADNRKHVDRLRGTSIKYCYGDEVVTWSEEVFEMLKSRLDKPYSRFDGTCNPKDPQHWFKAFLDSDADIFHQTYTIDDNPFLDEAVRNALKQEHRGVFYNRYILGEWCVAEGLVFPYFAEDATPYVFDPAEEGEKQYARISIGIDFGATGSLNTMCAVGFLGRFDRLEVLEENALPRGERIDTERIAEACAAFCEAIQARYGRYDNVFYDCADPALGNRIAALLRRRGLNYHVVAPCTKTALESRPVTVDGLLCAGRLRIAKGCRGILSALSQLRWDEQKGGVPEDKNIGNVNDYWDCFCYAWLAWQERFDRRAM